MNSVQAANLNAQQLSIVAVSISVTCSVYIGWGCFTASDLMSFLGQFNCEVVHCFASRCEMYGYMSM